MKDLVNNLLSTIPRISYEIPKGAFYYFIDVSKIETNTIKFCEDLLDSGLVLVPGDAFGRKGFVRLSFSAEKSKIVKGIKIFKEFCEKYK